MATLPIYPRQIITPYMLYGEEKAQVVQAANNKVYVARAGGYRYKLLLNITPFNILNEESALAFEMIRMTLTKNYDIEVPIFNTVPNGITSGIPEVAYGVFEGAPGSFTLLVWEESFTGTFNPGQYIKFSNKSKIYQVESYEPTISNYLGHDYGRIHLIQPLRQTVNPGALTAGPGLPPAGADPYIIYQEPGYNSVEFNGILGSFINEDFGNPAATIDGGILGTINTLNLIESV